MKRHAVFLDRDGVINRSRIVEGKPVPPASPDELELLPGVPEAAALLHAAGYLLIVVTNQPDVARGTAARHTVEEMNRHLLKTLPLASVRTCFHDDADFCSCRKPKPGLLLTAAVDFNLDLSGCYMVGDRWRDMEAGRRAGCRTIFIDYNYSEPRPELFDYSGGSLLTAARFILAESAGFTA